MIKNIPPGIWPPVAPFTYWPNPLTGVEVRAILDIAQQNVDIAADLLNTDPHDAEEYAYIALGNIQRIAEAVSPISYISELRGIANAIYRMAWIIIDEADRLQGRIPGGKRKTLPPKRNPLCTPNKKRKKKKNILTNRHKALKCKEWLSNQPIV